ncbi:Hypothetical predicted protein [Mytilus galloprovincialis]|uniref:Uncharacterized protein n=1 Tax=Mytilus galloprovincialis TaxID=29158 RepID=A0A8B6FJR2_MYTGA|nr:Hypothetical predicted protein [Mytilus galloprovincialis]
MPYQPISEMLNNHKTTVTESLSTIESKIKHCATGIDSLKTKANVADNLVKDLKANQVEHKLTIDKMSTLIVILDDRIESIIRRIQTERFTPGARCVKRFIRGGASTCTNFIEKKGTEFNTKNVLLHIGTRDLQNNGIKDDEFVKLLDMCTKTWIHAKVYVSLITSRRDFSDKMVTEANQIIGSVCTNYSNVTVIEQFRPSDNMFHDQVHLNNLGLSVIIKHLKAAMNLSPPSPRPLRHQYGQPNGSWNDRPSSAPPFQNIQLPMNNMDMTRPLSNPSAFESPQMTNHISPMNMMTPPPANPFMQWFPPQIPMNMCAPWRQPWNVPPYTSWPPNIATFHPDAQQNIHN